MNDILRNIIGKASNNIIHDLYSAICVVLVSIPLSMSVAIACNLPMTMVFLSAIIGGLISGIIGSNSLSVSGPAIAMTIILAQSGYIGNVDNIIFAGLVCGILQVTIGLFKLDNYTQFIPKPILYAFISSIGTIITFHQILSLQNISASDITYLNLITILKSFHMINPQIMFILMLTIVLLLILPFYLNLVISIIISVVVPSLIVYYNHWHQFKLVGTFNLSFSLHSINGNISTSHIYHDIISGVAIFIVASVETLLTSDVISTLQKKVKINNVNHEVMSNGIGNIIISLLGGVPITTVITRSKINILSGARTRLSIILYSFLLFIVVIYAQQLISNIPIIIMSAILIVAGIKMINFNKLYSYIVSDKHNFLIFIITYGFILFFDLIDSLKPILILMSTLFFFRYSTNKYSFNVFQDNLVVRIGLIGQLSLTSFFILNTIRKKINKLDNNKIIIFEFDQITKFDSTGINNVIEKARLLYNLDKIIIFHGGDDLLREKILEQLSYDQFVIFTITEDDIKQELNKNNITYNASEIIKHGIYKFNISYVNNNKSLIKKLSKQQKPHTLLITCSDSRIIPKVIFSSTIGELFIIRNIGNVIPKFNLSYTYSEIAAIEFALNVLNIRNIVICGHTECGAIIASIKTLDDSDNTGLSKWLDKIKEEFKKHEQLSYEAGVKINLMAQINNLKTYPMISNLLEKQELNITGLIYDMHTASIVEIDKDGLVHNLQS